VLAIGRIWYFFLDIFAHFRMLTLPPPSLFGHVCELKCVCNFAMGLFDLLLWVYIGMEGFTYFKCQKLVWEWYMTRERSIDEYYVEIMNNRWDIQRTTCGILSLFDGIIKTGQYFLRSKRET
jgi:hypothetical protein